MKKKLLITVSIMTVSLLCLAACYAAPGEVLVEGTCDDFTEHNTIYKKVVVALHGVLVVGLCPSPATGFEWDWNMSDPGIVNEVEHHYESREDDSAGVVGIDVWTFKAVKRGNTTIIMEQVLTGMEEEKVPWQLEISVSVR